MGLFDKKFCDVCGEKIGVFGNRKLEDGNLCKDCAAKLSPWFSDRRRSTVDDIKAQLEYRETNKEAVAAFHTTLTYGTNTKILLDEDNRKFMVTSARDLAKANPDVLDFSQITGCNLDIQESKTELKQEGPDGKDISYNPPQYSHEYDFYMVIQVNHPYFDEIRFKLNDSEVCIEPNIRLAQQRPMGGFQPARPMQQPNRPVQQPNRPGVNPGRATVQQPNRPVQQPNRPGVNPGRATVQMPNRPVQQPNRPVQQPNRPVGQMPVTQVISSSTVDPTMNVDYNRYVQMGEDIRAALLGIRQEARDEAIAAATPQASVTCPFCGAVTTPDASGCCEYCGSNLKA